MPTQVFEVEPVVAGLDSFIRIEYDAETVTALDLQSGSLKIDIRELPHSNAILVATKETGNGVSWVDNTLVIALSAADTVNLKSENVFFDLIHTNGGITQKIPGKWEWPVERSITVPNA